jgi:acetolactate synthase-like protein
VNAAFAADAVSRLTGTVGVCAVTAGPGLSNTVTAVKNCQMAQTPMLVLGGATSDILKGRASLQDIDQFALMKPHVKWSAHIASVDDIVPTLEKALFYAQDGTPGPVFVELPVDVLYPKKTVSSQFNKMKPPQNSIVGRIISAYVDVRYDSTTCQRIFTNSIYRFVVPWTQGVWFYAQKHQITRSSPSWRSWRTQQSCCS